VTNFPRPRRFGKTLNLSALRYFVEKRPEDLSHLFQDLAVWNDPAARAHFQRYPVLFLTFKDIRADTWESTLRTSSRLVSSGRTKPPSWSSSSTGRHPRSNAGGA
jgi:hypothetical protein